MTIVLGDTGKIAYSGTGGGEGGGLGLVYSSDGQGNYSAGSFPGVGDGAGGGGALDIAYGSVGGNGADGRVDVEEFTALN